MLTLHTSLGKKDRAFGADRSKGKGVSTYQNSLADLSFPGSRVIVGMSLLMLMYFFSNLSSLAAYFFLFFLLCGIRIDMSDFGYPSFLG